MDYQDKIISAIDKALAGVISIVVSKNVEAVEEEITKMGLDPRQFYAKIQNEAEDGKIAVSGGSGFIVDKSGVVLTNKHVVADKDATYKAIIGKEKYEIEILAKDPLSDIAILKLLNPPENLSTIKLGTSKNIKLGMAVVAIGNALGEFSNTVSTGIVSGLSRFLSAVTDMEGHQERLRGLIQTDAAINPGNSGGPLINLDGEAIGINSAIVFGAQNIGFAIPIDRVKRDLEQLKKLGHIQTPFLGIRYIILNKAIANNFGSPSDHGALIIKEGLPHDHAILPGSAAAKAGLKEHDIILAANGKQITEKETLEDILEDCKIGDDLMLEIQRMGKVLNFKLKLEERSKFN
ncbi:MAG TPA: trypsin-like peptidase domain-containing protein [Candidatus Paceibacterota bacterium]